MNGQPQLPTTCAFCRASKEVTTEEFLERFDILFDLGDAKAMILSAADYEEGPALIERNIRTTSTCKSFELTLRALELGYPRAFNRLFIFYNRGMVVGFDYIRQVACLKIAARGGYHVARVNLGHAAYSSGDIKLAL